MLSALACASNVSENHLKNQINRRSINSVPFIINDTGCTDTLLSRKDFKSLVIEHSVEINFRNL